MKNFIFSLITLCILSTIGLASTVTYSHTTPVSNSGAYSVRWNVPQFDPALGRLDGVKFNVQLLDTSYLGFENLETLYGPGQNYYYAMDVYQTVHITQYGTGHLYLDATLGDNALSSGFVNHVFDGNIDYAGLSGSTQSISLDERCSQDVENISIPYVGDFSGTSTNPVIINHVINFHNGHGNNNNGSVYFHSSLYANLVVTYTYS